MLTATEERLLKYIEVRAKENVNGMNFFKMTDVLEEAFLLTEDKAYEVFRNIMSRKNIGNSKYEIIDEYLDMLKKGYGSIQEQVEAFGGDKYSRVVSTARKRAKSYEGGTFFDVLRYIYNVNEEELLPLTEKYINFLSSPGFAFRLEDDTFNKFLESNIEELNKQFARFSNL